jgi:hypothetical protein
VPLSATHLIVRGRHAETVTERHLAIPAQPSAVSMLDGSRFGLAARLMDSLSGQTET